MASRTAAEMERKAEAVGERDLKAQLEHLHPGREVFHFCFLFFVLSKVVASLKYGFQMINLVEAGMKTSKREIGADG